MTPLPQSKSASRRYRQAAEVAVLRDRFEVAGVWPWKRSWHVEIELAHTEAIEFDIARRTMNGLLRWLWPQERVELLALDDTPLLRMIPRAGGSFYGVDRGASAPMAGLSHFIQRDIDAQAEDEATIAARGHNIPGLPRV